MSSETLETTQARPLKAPAVEPPLKAKQVPTPTASPAARWWSMLLGFLLLVLAAVAARDFIIACGWVDWQPWIAAVLTQLKNLSWGDWMYPTAVILIVVGLLLLLVALKPRRKKATRVDGEPSVWLRPQDVSRRTTAAVREVPGVLDAETVSSLGKTTVSYAPDPHSDRDLDSVVARVAESALSDLDGGRSVRVKSSRTKVGES